MNVIALNRQPEVDFGLKESAAVFPVTTRKLQANGLKVDSHKAVVRTDKDGDNPRVIGVVGTDFKVMPHGKLFGSMEKAIVRSMEPNLMSGFRVNTNVSFDGAWVQREYIFPAFASELKTSTGFKTNIGFRIIGWQGIDGSASAGCVSGLIDFYCSNGMVLGAFVDISKRRHTSGFHENHFDGQITAGIAMVQEEVRKLRKLAVTEMDMEQVEDLLSKKFSETRAAKMLERVETEVQTRGNNLFALHSALTYYASHNSEEFKVRDTGRDNEAKTLHTRQQEIAKIMPAVFALAA